MVNNNPARERALLYLGRFSRTRKQVKDYLKRKEFTPEQIEDAINYLVEHLYLNDRAFAESFIQEKIKHRDGPLKIRQMLYLKGIAPEDSTAILNELYPVELQQENVAALLQQKLRSGQSFSSLNRNEREKLFRFVASRGFNRYVIIQAFKSL
ncbi:MAG TPA: regulatory protein RecX [Acidobacteriota bacterium]|nr:regulatory protein RecX [Acidobacteriota bacterium]